VTRSFTFFNKFYRRPGPAFIASGPAIGVGPAGPQGPTGPAGPQGPTGPAGTTCEFVREGSTILRTAKERADTDAVRVADFMTAAQLAEAQAGTLTTDMAPAIQSAIDWAIYRGSASGAGSAKITMPAGHFRCNTSIHLGYGTNFTSAILEGQGSKVTVLFSFFSDRPAIVVQGGRQTEVRDLGVYGQNVPHIQSFINSATDASIAATAWVDPALHINAASRWAPYAGVAIDPYVGAPAAQQYPAVPYPAFLGAVPQYNKNFSSETRLVNVEIQGYVVGLLNQVGDATGNGDYTKIDRCKIAYCVYGVSVCNTQARLTHITDSLLSVVHTGVVTAVHGRQTGKPSIKVDNTEIGVCIKWLDAPNTSVGGGPEFEYCYGEGVYSIGNAGTVANSSYPVSFRHCEFSMAFSGLGVPAATFEYFGTGICTFDACTFVRTTGGRMNFFGNSGARSFRFAACNSFTEFETVALYQKIALNSTCGVTFVGFDSRGLSVDPLDFSCRVTNAYNLDTGASANSRVYGRVNAATRIQLACVYSERIIANDRDAGFSLPNINGSVSKSALSFAAAGRDVTVTLTGRTNAQFALEGGDAGDIVWDDASGAVFYVRARTGAQIIMRAQTGYNAAGNLHAAPNNSGSLWFLNCRRYTPPYVTYATLTSGSAALTAVQRDDGDASYLESDLPAGDFFCVDSRVDNFLPSSGLQITASNNAAKTVTANGNFTRSETRKRLTTFVRAAPANV
jgi:hypothetical protein